MESSAGCYYKLNEEFYLPVDQWCAGIALNCQPIFGVGGVYFLIFLRLWYGGMQVVHHDVCIFVLQEVPHVMVKQTRLGHLKCWTLWDVDEKTISILAVVGHKVIEWTRPRDRMLDIPLGLYQTGSKYPGRSPIVLVCVTPVLQWKCIYCPLGASIIFERYFPLMNALHINRLSIRHKF